MTRTIEKYWIGWAIIAAMLSASASAQEKRENPKPNALDFTAKLLQGHPYTLTKDETTAVDEAFRQMREAEDQMRKAKDDEARRKAAKAQADADGRLVAVLEKSPNLKRISLAGGKVSPSILGPHEMVGDTGALLLRVDNGGEGMSFSAYDINESLPERGKIVWIDYAPTGVTWVLLGMNTLPARRITLPVEFHRPGAEPIRTLVEVTMPPVGRLKLTVLSDDTGKPTPAMVRITSKATGRDRKPSNAIDLTGQFDGNGQNTSRRPANIPGRQGGAWWCIPEPLDITLPPGEYDIAIRRGIEHTPIFESFTIRSKEVTEKSFRPKRWTDMRKLGWFSGDDHVHGQILSDDDAARLMAWLVAEDVHLGNVVKMGDITRTYFEQRGFGKDYRVINSDYVLSPGQECPRTHDKFIGHTLSMNIADMVRDTDKYYLYDFVADGVHAQGGLWGYAHVNSGIFQVHRDMSVNIPKAKCDFAEVLQFGNLGTDLWYQFLNLGFKVTASCGSDVPWGGTIGEVRLYACTGKKPFDPDAWFEAVRKGHTFVTNGPMIEFTVNDALPGDEIVVKDNAKLHIRVKAMGQPEFSQPEYVKVVKFGQEVKVAKPAKNGDTEITLEFDMDAGHGCWLAAVTRATNGCHAHTTPIYVRREGLRWWKFEEVDQLLDKRFKSLKEIEGLVADAKSRDAITLDGDQELKQLALQGDELLKRVEAARKIYEDLKQTAEKEQAVRGKG